jgi:predicted porin
MRRTIVFALGLAALATTAQAADLDLFSGKATPFYDPLPDSLTWHGITVYGTLDLGYAYQTNGRPLGNVVSGLEFIPFTTTRNYTGQSVSTIAHSGLEQSKIGVKFDEPLGLDWAVIGKLDTGFDPLTGKLSDGCSSFIQNASVPYARQTSNADSGRCGQTFNGEAYGGISNPLYGKLTIGRQNSLQLDNIAVYDPLTLSYAFSLLGYSGTDGGSGSTQAARWDNSAKYVYQYGPVHAAAMYSTGGVDTGIFGNSYGFDIGGVYKGFSVDAVYSKEHGVVNLQTAVNDAAGSQTLAASISDNETWSIMGKYTFQFPGHGTSTLPTKAAKAEAPGDKLTLFVGYTHIDQSNPQNPVFSGDAAGGIPLTIAATTVAPATSPLPDNNAFTTDKVLQFFWAGAKYELAGGLSFTGAYYHVNQNSFVQDSAPCIAGGASKTDCAGTFDQFSLLADYQVTKHLDVYAGITYGKVENGLASGFPGTPGAKPLLGPAGTVSTGTSVDTTSMMTGFRVKL